MHELRARNLRAFPPRAAAGGCDRASRAFTDLVWAAPMGYFPTVPPPSMRHDLAPGRKPSELENEQLKEQVRLLERKVESLTRRTPGAKRRSGARGNGT